MNSMPYIDYLIYAAHTAFWLAFGVTRMATARPRTVEETPGSAAAAGSEGVAFARTAVAIHMVAFAVMYFGLGQAVIPHAVPTWFVGQRLAGFGVILLGAVLASWAVASFQSWRFQAKLDAGHQLATGGPFRYLRHPIYAALNLLALGSAVWVPTMALWIAFGLMVIGSEVRARLEERLLHRAFGQTYADYSLRTKRFIPGIY